MSLSFLRLWWLVLERRIGHNIGTSEALKDSGLSCITAPRYLIIVRQTYFRLSVFLKLDSFFREDAETLVLTSGVRVFDWFREVVTIIYGGSRISSLIHWHGLVWSH